MPPLPRRKPCNDFDLPPLTRNGSVQFLDVTALEHIGQHLQGAPGAGIERPMRERPTEDPAAALARGEGFILENDVGICRPIAPN